MQRKRQKGFTLIEAVLGLGIVAMITPALATSINQTSTVTEDTSTSLNISASIGQAAEWITNDSNEVETYIDVTDENYADLIPGATELDYGAFVEIDDSSEVTSYVRYYYDDGNLARESSKDGGSTNVITSGIAEYNDVDIKLNGSAVDVVITVTHNMESKQESFQANLEGFDGHSHRVPLTISYDDGLTLEDRKVLVALNSDNFDYTYVGDKGVDLRFPVEYSLYELPLTIQGKLYSKAANYDVKVVITDSAVLSHVAHGNDLRFYNDQCSTPYGGSGFGEVKDALSYWVEELTETQMVIWVRLTDTPSKGRTIYMYYGNPFAVAKSDASFLVKNYWDFSCLDGWKIISKKWKTTNGVLSCKNGNGYIIYNDGDMTKVGQEYEAEVSSITGKTNIVESILFGYQDKNNYYEASVTNKKLILRVAWFEKGKQGQGNKKTVVAQAPIQGKFDKDETYTLTVQWTTANHVNVYLEKQDGTVVSTIEHEGTKKSTDLRSDITSGYLGVRANNKGGLDNLSIKTIAGGSTESLSPLAVAGDEKLLPLSGDQLMLNYEIEEWETDGKSRVWLEIPYIAKGDTLLHMYYGNSSALSQSAKLKSIAAEGVTISLDKEESIG
ncbi:MAG: DUF2341 domain-containing protein [Chloroflexota bacterium]|nr:DUF2341 domain-containing protein [Chloroflexota bacterium]